MGKITYWEDLNVNYDHLIYQSIIIDKELIENLHINISNPEATLKLTCISSQNYPNGTLIFESSKSQLFEILTSKFVFKTCLGPFIKYVIHFLRLLTHSHILYHFFLNYLV